MSRVEFEHVTKRYGDGNDAGVVYAVNDLNQKLPTRNFWC